MQNASVDNGTDALFRLIRYSPTILAYSKYSHLDFTVIFFFWKNKFINVRDMSRCKHFIMTFLEKRKKKMEESRGYILEIGQRSQSSFQKQKHC